MNDPEEGMSLQPLPWHSSNWERFRGGIQSNRMPHAVLLTGTAGVGKARFARALAAALLCEVNNEQGIACGACNNCRMLQAGAHPDFTLIQPEEPGKAIRIDTIREFTARGALTSQTGGYKAIILEPADALNSAAANSLLKTLEEPVERTVMILVTSRPGRLPATIRSRCQRYDFPPPEAADARTWLQQQGVGDPSQAELLLSLAAGAPLLALHYARNGTLEERATMIQETQAILKGQQDPVAVAQRWSQLDQGQVIQWFSGWLIDIIRLKIASQAAAIINIDQRERLQALAREVNSKRVYALLDRLIEANRTLGAQLNTQMQLESLLLDWADLGVE
ncbi:MAG: DNA polymerase III subunit delta' [Sedimenticola sp.]|nr:DNA polymerase III subunit delta' [Sedimenticola sp.]